LSDFLDLERLELFDGTVNRLERLYAISEFIRQRGSQPVTAAHLADRFDVSQRTIERDLASLREAGAPLVGEPGRNGGAVHLDSSAGVLVALTAPQVTSLLMAVAVAGSDMPYSADATTGAEVLLAGLATNTRTHVAELRDRIRCEDRPSTVVPRIQRTVEEAVRRGVVVNITYVDAAGTETERSVQAIGFYQGADAWFLNGWCELRQDGRIFALHRIRSARLTRRKNQSRSPDEVLGWVPNETRTP
jgi:predicted DNA-binding transcriptional regulator YafY